MVEDYQDGNQPEEENQVGGDKNNIWKTIFRIFHLGSGSKDATTDTSNFGTDNTPDADNISDTGNNDLDIVDTPYAGNQSQEHGTLGDAQQFDGEGLESRFDKEYIADEDLASTLEEIHRNDPLENDFGNNVPINDDLQAEGPQDGMTEVPERRRFSKTKFGLYSLAAAIILLAIHGPCGRKVDQKYIIDNSKIFDSTSQIKKGVIDSKFTKLDLSHKPIKYESTLYANHLSDTLFMKNDDLLNFKHGINLNRIMLGFLPDGKEKTQIGEYLTKYKDKTAGYVSWASKNGIQSFAKISCNLEEDTDQLFNSAISFYGIVALENFRRQSEKLGVDKISEMTFEKFFDDFYFDAAVAERAKAKKIFNFIKANKEGFNLDATIENSFGMKVIKNLIKYNQSVGKGEKIRGILFDTNYYSSLVDSDFAKVNNELLLNLRKAYQEAGNTDELVQSGNNVEVYFTLNPRWNIPLDYNGTKRPFYKHWMDSTLMDEIFVKASRSFSESDEHGRFDGTIHWVKNVNSYAGNIYNSLGKDFDINVMFISSDYSKSHFRGKWIGEETWTRITLNDGRRSYDDGELVIQDTLRYNPRIRKVIFDTYELSNGYFKRSELFNKRVEKGVVDYE